MGIYNLNLIFPNWCTGSLHMYTYFLVALLSIGEYVSSPIGVV